MTKPTSKPAGVRQATRDDTQGPKVPAGARLELSLDANYVSLRGQRLDALPTDKPQRLTGLFTALKQAEPSAGIELQLQPGTLGAGLLSVVFTASLAGHREHLLAGTQAKVVLQVRVPRPPNDADQTELSWAEPTLMLIARAQGVEVWTLRGVGDNSQPASTGPAPLLTVSGEPVEPDLTRALEPLCRRATGCGPMLVAIAADARFDMLQKVLGIAANWSEPSRALQARLVLQLPERAGTPPQIRIGATTVSGRLPPELIQRVVRENFAAFQKCYEQGLARKSDLMGTVKVRFVIARDGHVPNAVAGPDTDFADAEVVACVVEQFRALEFPPPEGGIVTVVYPLRFEPGDEQ